MHRDIAVAVLWEVAGARQRLHRVRWEPGHTCDTTLIAGGQTLLRSGSRDLPAPEPTADHCCSHCLRRTEYPPPIVAPATGSAPRLRFVLTGDCVCQQLLADAFTAVFEYLEEQGSVIVSPAAAARRHIRHRQHDHQRSTRGEMGAQTRTDRLEHTAVARTFRTQEQRWLLRDIADEAGSSAPLDGDEQLIDRLATLRARRLRCLADELRDSVRADLVIVEAACRRGRRVNVGTVEQPEFVSWWEAFVERPLGRRRRLSNLSIHDDATGHVADRTTYSRWLNEATASSRLAPALTRSSAEGDHSFAHPEILARLKACALARPTRTALHVLTSVAHEFQAIHSEAAMLGEMLADEHRRRVAVEATQLLVDQWRAEPEMALRPGRDLAVPA